MVNSYQEIMPLKYEGDFRTSIGSNINILDKYNDETRAFFVEGELYDYYPQMENVKFIEIINAATNAHYWNVDGIDYNLYNPEDIMKIPLKDYPERTMMPERPYEEKNLPIYSTKDLHTFHSSYRREHIDDAQSDNTETIIDNGDNGNDNSEHDFIPISELTEEEIDKELDLFFDSVESNVVSNGTTSELFIEVFINRRAGLIWYPYILVPFLFKRLNQTLYTDGSIWLSTLDSMIYTLISLGEERQAEYMRKMFMPYAVDREKELGDNFIKNYPNNIALCRKHEIDLIEITACSKYLLCGTCVKYANRMYSLSGSNKEYPKLPEIFLKSPFACENECKLEFDMSGLPIEKKNYDTYMLYDLKGKRCDVDRLKSTKRPFIDDRTEEEKAYYEAHKEEIRECRMTYTVDYRNYLRRHLEYQQLVDFMPDDAPKSFSGYSNMKNHQTKNFLKLKQKAEMNGIII